MERIKYIDIGIGNRVGNMIYLNSSLKYFPKLHTAILNHEKRHTGKFSWGDFRMDTRIKELKGIRKQYYLFLLKNPKAWLNFLPIMKIGDFWTYDLGVLLIWIFVIFVGAIMWFLL